MGKGLRDDEMWYKDIQGNILKGNGRDFQRLLFVDFGQSTKQDICKLLKKLPLSSFYDQLVDSKEYKKTKNTVGESFYQVMLSKRAYDKLCIPESLQPHDFMFQKGMNESTVAALIDPPESWNKDITYVDCVVLIAGDGQELLNASESKIHSLIRDNLADGKVLYTQKGYKLTNDAGEGIEHFGFKDNISQPLFLKRDIDHYSNTFGNDKFNAAAPKELVLVEDHFTGGYGSYVAIQKFNQDTDTFSKTANKLKELLGLNTEEEAASLILGRRKDGSPLVVEPRTKSDSTNNFDFKYDAAGVKCPFHSHIRKMNDREESLRLGSDFQDTLKHRIARRGFAFGDTSSDDKGLLFLAYQSNISNQFEHLLGQFAHNSNYPESFVGSDALIGNSEVTGRVNIWKTKSGDNVLATLEKFITLKGGQYLYAPSISFFKNIDSLIEKKELDERVIPSTGRTIKLRTNLIDECFSNRSKRWFKQEELGSIFQDSASFKNESVVVRQATACKRMLSIMMDPKIGKRTRTYGIHENELIVGTLPMGSVGLGKQFPKFLLEEEVRSSSLSNRDEGSIFGHTTPNFRRVLNRGLNDIVSECNAKVNSPLTKLKQKEFYKGVIISSEAVIDYSNKLAEVAKKQADQVFGKRKEELLKIAEICRKVPAKPAETFYEALQAVWMIHLAQSAFCVFNSLGRLDTLLNPYLEKDLAAGTITKKEAIELVECFLIKAAERLNLNPAHLKEQDHLSYGTGIGTRPIYLDQVASCNNFIQNIVLAGKDLDGVGDVFNVTTEVFLKAAGGVGLCTPTINVRVHSNSPKELLDLVDETFRRAKTGHPILFNDESIIPGMLDSGLPSKLAYDYAIAGCWEPVMNGQSAFIFGMVNMLIVLECALNEGKLFNPDNQFLKGQKQSYESPPVEEYKSFNQLLAEVAKQMQFWSDKVAIGTCTFYTLPGSMTPSPFFSMLLDGCLERGIDQAEGGADINLISNIAFAIPNVANALANIKYFVFEKKLWTLREVTSALSSNWGLLPVRSAYESNPIEDQELKNKYHEMRRAFLHHPQKYGNNEQFSDEIMAFLMNKWAEVTRSSAEYAKKVFISDNHDEQAQKLRNMANYPAPSFRESMRSDIELHFTTGAGTFGQYSSMGKGVSASADGRAAHDPVVPNCSPATGTCTNGLSALFKSIAKTNLDKFGSAVVTDIRVDGVIQEEEFFKKLVKDWVRYKGSMLTVTVLSNMECEYMFNLTKAVETTPDLIPTLKQYSDRFCRVGGWNSNFICLPRSQQRDHCNRGI